MDKATYVAMGGVPVAVIGAVLQTRGEDHRYAANLRQQAVQRCFGPTPDIRSHDATIGLTTMLQWEHDAPRQAESATRLARTGKALVIAGALAIVGGGVATLTGTFGGRP